MFNIAIDGPGGAGKSSVSKLVAQKLGIIYVDTGALYRSIALHMSRHGICTEDVSAVVRELPNVKISLRFTDRQVLMLDGEEVGDAIRTPEMSMGASRVSAIPEVRSFLLDTQRQIAKKNSVIMDGRDIGTVILPDADLKIFLFANEAARARRRYEELLSKGKEVTYEDVLAEMRERDSNDSTRAVAPCVPAPDAIMLDNSDLTLEGTADAIIAHLNAALYDKKTRRTYLCIRKIFAPLIRALWRVRIEGVENLPASGGIILCSNHIAAIDPILIAAVCPRPIHFIAKKELFSVPIIKGLITAAGAIKIDRGGNDVAAIRTAVRLAKRGEAVALFPQGHRYPGVDPATTPLKNGAAHIAHHAKSAVVPVCIQTKGAKYAFLRPVTVKIGAPIPYDSLGITKGEYDEYRAATETIFSEITKMSDYSTLPAFTEDKK